MSDTRSSAPIGRWQAPLVTAALAVGLVLLALQLWLLTVALDLVLGGSGEQVWELMLASGVIFAGGVLVLRFLRAPSRGAPFRPER